MKTNGIIIVILLGLLCGGCQEQAAKPAVVCDLHARQEVSGQGQLYDGSAEERQGSLLQSHAGEIRLLPALPKSQPDGSVKGLVAAGGYVVDIDWAKGKLVGAVIRPGNDGVLVIRYDGKKLTTVAKKGVPLRVTDYGGLRAKEMRCCF